MTSLRGDSVPSVSDKITLYRHGRSHEMLFSQISTKNLQRTFQVDPEQVWLKDRGDHSAYLPNDDGHFNLKECGVQYFQDLDVEGPASTVTPLSSALAQQTAVARGAPIPSLTPVTPLSSTSSKRKESSPYSLKITKAEVSLSGSPQSPTTVAIGKTNFEGISTMYLELNESSANVTLIKAAMQRKWGQDFTLVSNDGVELEDSSGTEGLNFWRAPKRKFFAIRKSKPVERGLKRHRDSDVQLSSHECSGECNREWKTKIFKQLESIQMGLENLYEVNKCSPIPVGITKALAEVLKCKICHCIPMKPPLIYAKCCKSIVGCEMCINKWYEGDEALTKPCPLCAQARGYNETQRIHGFDNLSTTVESLF